MGCVSCKKSSCSGTCGGEVSKFLTSSLVYDGVHFVCKEAGGGSILFEIHPCMGGNELLELLFQKLCEGLSSLSGAVANIGTGSEWYKGLNGGTHEFKTFLTEPGFTITTNPNDLTLGINFISSDASVTINVVGNDIDFVSNTAAGVVNVGSGTGEVYAGLNLGNHEFRKLLESKWTKIDTVGSDVEIRGKRFGHRIQTFKSGSVECFEQVGDNLVHKYQYGITDLGSELSIVPLNEYLALVTAYIKISVNVVNADFSWIVVKMELPDDFNLNTGGATEITNNYLQNNTSVCYYDLQAFDPNTDIPNRYTNKLISEGIAFYDDGLGGTELFPMGTKVGNVLAIRYMPIGIGEIPTLWTFSGRVTIPVKMNSDWDYLETISPNYVKNW